MSQAPQSSDLTDTRASLLLRLCDRADVAAWDEFVAIYSPLIYRLGRRQGLQPADADDLVQEVFAAVCRSVEDWLKRSDRGRFRAWLFRIARNTTVNFLTRPKHRPLAAGGSEANQVINDLPAAEPSSSEFQTEYKREIFRWASEQVRDVVTSNTWQAFWETTLQDRSAAEVARELGMSVGSVYIARSRVMARLKQFVRRVEGH